MDPFGVLLFPVIRFSRWYLGVFFLIHKAATGVTELISAHQPEYWADGDTDVWSSSSAHTLFYFSAFIPAGSYLQSPAGCGRWKTEKQKQRVTHHSRSKCFFRNPFFFFFFKSLDWILRILAGFLPFPWLMFPVVSDHFGYVCCQSNSKLKKLKQTSLVKASWLWSLIIR